MPHEWTDADDRDFHRFAFLHTRGWHDDLPRFRRRDTLDDAPSTPSGDPDDQEADLAAHVKWRPTRWQWAFIAITAGLLLVLAVM